MEKRTRLQKKNVGSNFPAEVQLKARASDCKENVLRRLGLAALNISTGHMGRVFKPPPTLPIESLVMRFDLLVYVSPVQA